MGHESGDLGHMWQSSTYEIGNEGHEKIKLAITAIWLVMRDKRLAMREIAKIRLAMRDISNIRVGNNRHEH